MWHLESCPKRKTHNIGSPGWACRITLIVEGTEQLMEHGRAAAQFQLGVLEALRMFPCSGVDHRVLVWYWLKRWGKCFWDSFWARKQDKDNTCTSKLKVNGWLKLLKCSHFQSCIHQQRLLVLQVIGYYRVGTPLAVSAVHLHPSYVLVGNMMLPFVGHCTLCNAGLLPAWTVGGRWVCG